ncbi:MAG: acyl-CoA synthetase [Chloroflexi bacterium]|nr:MAG: acyl-CoA synthetase [Chloroflexota bacterium]
MAVRRNLRDSLVSLRERCEARSAGDGATERGPIDLARGQLSAARVLAEARVLRPSRPDRMLAALLALHRWGLTVPGGFSASAARYPDDVFVVDDAGTYTFAAIDRRTNALVNALHAAGVGEGSRAGILCRNHAWFVESLVALTKLGADVVLLNTDYAGPQLRDVLERERVNVIVHDAEYGATLTKVRPSTKRFVAWTDAKRPSTRTLQRLTEATPIAEPDPPEQPSRITILTSGTTGTPKGASRSQPHSADPIVGTLSRMPLRSRETTLIAAVLASIEGHHVTGLIAVPMMLRRILDLPRQTRRRYDTSSLRVVAVSGSALPAELATSFMDEYGDILYNLYGSTEVAAATIATPEDMRRAPGTAGRPPYATVVRLLDEQGRDVPQGSVGRIFVGNDMLFEGYTDADGADTMHGLMSTGDLGRMDADGRLFVEGRSDDMIVSGGENVFPAEVEELLQAHPHVADAAVIGVPDEEWGGRLRAYVVKRRGARLTVDDLKGHVRGHLARYKVPRDIVFVKSVPRNPTGKVLKAALRDAKTSPA